MSAEPIDPAAVMAAHAGEHWCYVTRHHPREWVTKEDGPCEPYRLSEALTAVTDERDDQIDQANSAERERDRALKALAAERTAHEGALVMLTDRNTELAAEQAKVARVEALPDMWMSRTEEGQRQARDHWRGRDYIEGEDWGTETCAGELRAALADQP